MAYGFTVKRSTVMKIRSYAGEGFIFFSLRLSSPVMHLGVFTKYLDMFISC